MMDANYSYQNGTGPIDAGLNLLSRLTSRHGLDDG